MAATDHNTCRSGSECKLLNEVKCMRERARKMKQKTPEASQEFHHVLEAETEFLFFFALR